MDFTDVLENFMVLSKLEESECTDYHGLIKTSILDVTRRLKPGVSVDKNKELLIQLTGAIAYYRYNILANTQNSDISISDLKVSVNSSKEIGSARLYKNEMLSIASHLLKDDHFMFGVMD